MQGDVRKLVRELHASPQKAVVAVAGAGARALSWLLGVPGASRTVLEAVAPYSSAALSDFIGAAPAQFVSPRTARDMAAAAYRRAVRLRDGRAPVVGVGCTATIATDRPKRGQHRCHVTAWHAAGYATYSLQFVKGLRDRAGEDEAVSRLLLRALADACGLRSCLPLELHEDERVFMDGAVYDDPLDAALHGHVSTVVVHPDGSLVADEVPRGGFLSGSFNPLHEGHQRLACVASGLLGCDVTFEVSITNVDKPPLEETELRRRTTQFAGRWPVVVTRAPVFVEKGRLFPGCTFVIGWDTAVRLVDPLYYGGEEVDMLAALLELRRLSCRFLVAGRVDGGVFRTLDHVDIPRGVKDMFAQIPESAFRSDLSSTQLRVAGRGA